MNDKSIPRLRFPEFVDEWEQRKLGDRMYIKSRIGWQALTKKEYLESGDYYLITGTDIDEDTHTVDLSRCYYVSKERYDMDDKIQVREGDIIVTKDGTIGKVAMVTGLDKPATLNSHLFVLRDMSGNLDNRFLLQILSSQIFTSFVESTKTGSTLTGLPQKTFVEFEFLAPKMDEQKQISRYFDNLDNFITLYQRRFDRLKELRDGLIQRILSRELRFKRTDGSEFENWVTKELSEIFTERKVSQTITEDAPLLSFTIEQGVINPQDKKTNKRDFLIKDKDTKKFALTEVDDIIYNPANLKYGAIHRNKLMRGVVSPIYAIFYTEQNPAFMEYVVKNPTFIKNSLKYLEGTVIKLMTLKPKDFLKLKVEIPASLEEQKIIADFLMQFDETIGAEQRRIEKWKELKKGLIQQMFI